MCMYMNITIPFTAKATDGSNDLSLARLRHWKFLSLLPILVNGTAYTPNL